MHTDLHLPRVCPAPSSPNFVRELGFLPQFVSLAVAPRTAQATVYLKFILYIPVYGTYLSLGMRPIMSNIEHGFKYNSHTPVFGPAFQGSWKMRECPVWDAVQVTEGWSIQPHLSSRKRRRILNGRLINLAAASTPTGPRAMGFMIEHPGCKGFIGQTMRTTWRLTVGGHHPLVRGRGF